MTPHQERTQTLSTLLVARPEPVGQDLGGHSRSRFTLAAAVLGFFVITLDAVVVNVALPPIRGELGGGITGLQWVVDGYTLMFAAILLTAGALSDRIGARRAFAAGLSLFVAASAACGLAPTLGALVSARFVQGAAAAVLMPSSMALIRQAYQDPTRWARAVAVWAMGGAVASSSGPVLGGLLTQASWRLIFAVNVPAGAVALALLRRTERSPPPRVLFAFAVAVLALAAFLAAQAHGAHPMVPLELFRSRNLSAAVAVGFAFIVGYYGLPFVMSLYLQQLRGLSPLATGVTFLPMMLVGAVFTPFSARLAERLGARLLIGGGLVLMTVGLAVLAVVPASTPVWVLAGLMVLVGLAGPLVSPPVTAVLLDSVPAHRAGVASGVFNTSRQVGGAPAVAVFGALLVQPASFLQGLRTSLLLAAGVALAAAAVSRLLQPRVVAATGRAYRPEYPFDRGDPNPHA